MDLRGLRIGLLTASASRLGGGVFEAVASQAAMIRDCGGDARVFALRDPHSADDADRFAAGSVAHLRVLGPAIVGFAPRLLDAMLRSSLDCLHLHGIWMYPSRAATLWAGRTGRPYLVSPHGMLDRWITARGRAKKAVARLAYERASWRTASAFHALTPREAADIEREAGRRDTLVIPNAGPPSLAPRDRMGEAHFVYLGRIHPKKNLDRLIAAWTQRAAAVDAAGARLTIAGWGEPEHLAQLREALRGTTGSVTFVGPTFGEAKDRLLRQARFLVLPSLSEGLPVAILEAWAAAVPTIMSEQCNLEEGFAAGAAIDSGLTTAQIAAGIGRALAVPEREWLDMAQAAHRLASSRFAASTVAGQWARSYRAMIETRGKVTTG